MSSDDIIEFYSDFNCPFCYALNERLVAIGDTSKIAWRGIEHEASATSKVVTLDEKNQLLNEVTVIRKRAPEIPFVTPPFRPNTRIINQVVYAMRGQDLKMQSEFRTLIYRALWVEGLDISDLIVLKKLADEVGLIFPSEEEINQKRPEIEEWQATWQGPIYKTRLPVLVASENNKPLLGFPTYDLLYHFFNGTDLPVAPDSLAACQLKPKQNILMVGKFDPAKCNMIELEFAYYIVRKESVVLANDWLSEQNCAPDVILIDDKSMSDSGLELCSRLKRDQYYRHTSIMFLLDKLDTAQEMAAFDVGAVDVVFDLSNPKVCQARLDAQLRAKQSATILEALARLDYLTELPNRREFDRKFEEEWLRATRSGTPVSVVLVDIDHFKLYNDHYGHTAGDDCLRSSAKAMVSAIKRTADLLARYGGEEFSAVLPDTNEDGAITVAEAIRQSVYDANIPHEKSLVCERVTISVGIATCIPKKGMMPESLTELADEALYQSKMNGRNRVTASEKRLT